MNLWSENIVTIFVKIISTNRRETYQMCEIIKTYLWSSSFEHIVWTINRILIISTIHFILPIIKQCIRRLHLIWLIDVWHFGLRIRSPPIFPIFIFFFWFHVCNRIASSLSFVGDERYWIFGCSTIIHFFLNLNLYKKNVRNTKWINFGSFYNQIM